MPINQNEGGADLSYLTMEKMDHVNKIAEMDDEEFRTTAEIFESASAVVKARKKKEDT